MATSGSFQTNIVPDYGVNFSAIVNWTAGTPNVENNYTPISWTIKASTAGSGYKRGVYGVRFVIDGSYVINTSGSKRGDYGDGATIASGSTNVYHLNDGTKTMSMSLTMQLGQDYTWTQYITSGSGSFTLDSIARASTITFNSTYVITSSSGNLPFTITPYASFYHKAVWTLNNSATTVNYTTAISTATTKTDITDALMLNKLSNAASGTLTLVLYTYTDSALTTLVGSNTASCVVSIDTSAIKPTAAISSVSAFIPALQDSDSLYSYPVAGYAKLNVTWTATAPSGTSISSTRIVILKKISSTTYETTETITATGAGATTTTGFLPISETDYVVNVALTTIDARGASSTTVVSADLNVYGYKPPVITLTAFRTETNATTTEDGSGAYAYISYTRTPGASIDNKNVLGQISCTYSGDVSGTISTNPSHIQLSEGRSIEVSLTVPDKLSSSSLTRYIAPAYYPIDLYDNGAGKVGVGLGLRAEPGFVKTNLPTKGIFLYGTCDTAGGTAAKVATLIEGLSFSNDFLVTGTTIFIRFTNANTASSPTLSIKQYGASTGTTAKSIRRYGTSAPGTSSASSWNNDSIVCLTYDGTYWRQVGFLNSTYSEISTTNIINSTNSTTGTITGRRFNYAFTHYMGVYRRLVWCKDSANTGIEPGSNTTATKVIVKQVGTAFSISNGNIVCSVAGTVKVTAKIFAYHSSNNGGGMTCAITKGGVNESDTQVTVSWFSNGIAYLEAILDVAANDTLNVYVKNEAASGSLSVQATSSMIVEYL